MLNEIHNSGNKVVVDLHAKTITVKTMQEEFRVNSVRLEEKRWVECCGPCTPLIAACWFGKVDVVRFLLTAGANFEAKSEVIMGRLSWVEIEKYPRLSWVADFGLLLILSLGGCCGVIMSGQLVCFNVFVVSRSCGDS